MCIAVCCDGSNSFGHCGCDSLCFVVLPWLVYYHCAVPLFPLANLSVFERSGCVSAHWAVCIVLRLPLATQFNRNILCKYVAEHAFHARPHAAVRLVVDGL